MTEICCAVQAAQTQGGLRDTHVSGIGSVSVTLLALMSGSSKMVASETASSAARATAIVSTSHQTGLSEADADVDVSLVWSHPSTVESAHRLRLLRRGSRAERPPTTGDAYSSCVAEPSSALI